MSGDAPAAKPRKRRRGAEHTAGLSQEELARRARQRQLRDLALRLRAAGQEYSKKKQRRKAARDAGGAVDEHKPRRPPQVIVLPIFWNKKEAEKESVLAAAGAALRALRAAGLQSDLDSTHERTPGQKMRYWEERGVKARVEVGPRDAEGGKVVLALCSDTPGEVAQKRTLPAGRLVGELCKVLGLPPPPGAAAPGAGPAQALATAGEKDEAAAAQLEAQSSPGKKPKRSKKTAEEEGRRGGSGGGRAAAEGPSAAAPEVPAQPPTAGTPRPSGDDLEGDFAELAAAAQEDAAAGRGKKGGKKKARAEQPPLAVPALPAPGGKRQRQPKKVVF